MQEDTDSINGKGGMEDEKKQIEESAPNMKEKVMGEIKNKKIKMRSHFIFLAEKLGMQSALAALLVVSALLISLIFYFFKKTGILKFLVFGTPGWKIFILALPYDYIVLFLIALLAAIYFANKLEIPCHENISYRRIFFYFFIASVLSGIFFALVGFEKIFKGWSKKRVPEQLGVDGRIKKLGAGEVDIEDEDGRLVRVFFERSPMDDKRFDGAEGKFFRAVGAGEGSREDGYRFHATDFECCTGD
jgi:hypothetical protein